MSQPIETQLDSEPHVAPEVFWLDSWKVEPSLNRLSRADQEVHLEPKVMDVLSVLASRPGRLASRAEIQTEVWRTTHVTDDVMTRAIFELRKALGDEARSPRYIETIHGRGYRLIAPISLSAPAEPLSVVPPLPAVAARRPRMWAMPLGAAVTVIALVWLAGVLGTDRETADRSPFRETPLTSSPGREAYPALSPDAERVAFSMPPERGAWSDLFVKDRATDEVVSLAAGPAEEYAPIWSSDGTQVAFLRCGRDEEVASGVYVVPASGGEETMLFPTEGCAAGFDWSPDDRQLVVAARRADVRMVGLLLVDVQTGEATVVTTPPEPYNFDSAPRFSPDGRQVAFRRKLGAGTLELFVVGLEDASLRQLTRDAQDIGGLAWASDGESIIYSSNRTGSFGLWRLSMNGKAPVWLGFENAFRPAAARRSGAVAFERRRNDVHIRRIPNPYVNLAGSPSFLLESTHYDLDPQYSPDGSQIAFISGRSGSHELWVAAADGSEPRQLTSFRQPGPGWIPGVQHPRWSRSGSRLLFTARHGGDFDLYTVGFDGEPARAVTDGPGDDLTPIWSQDEQWVYFVSNRSTGWRLWRVRPEGGEAEALAPEGLIPGIQHGPDRSLVLTTRRGLLSFDLESSSIQEIPFPVNRRAWISRAEGIYHLRDCELALTDPVSGETQARELQAFMTPAAGFTVVASGLSMSPDGAWLIYSAVERSESDIVLVEGPF